MTYLTIRARDLRPGVTILSRPHRWHPTKIRDVVTIAPDCLLLRHEGGEYTVGPDDEIRVPAPEREQEGLF